MTLRGIISPPRSRSSPRDNRPYYTPTNNNATTTNNPPSKPNYMSPRRRRPAAAAAVNKPNELQRSPRIETTTTTTTHSTAAKPKSNNDNRRSSNTTSRIDPSKPTTKIKKSDGNSATKSATKISSRPSSSSPRATAARSGSTPPSKTSSLKAGLGGSGSRSDTSGAKGSGGVASQKSRNESAKQDVKIADVHSQLQQLSFDGKDLASIVLQANSIYESLGSDTKEECSSQTNTNAPRIFQIHKEITSHRQDTNSSITSYFTKLKELWDELATYSDLPQCSCGAIEKLSDHTEREKAMQFLAGLNDSYSSICTQILLLRPFPTVERAYTVMIREEKRRELVSSLEMVAATVMQNNWLLQNGHSSNSDGIDEVAIYQNEVTSLPIEPLLIDLGSPVRC